jgi:putative ABC transport system permease protein
MRDSILQDLQYALRTARRAPGFVAAAAGILALGIGANTAMFSIVSGVLLRPLPYSDPDRLVQLNEFDPRFGTKPSAVAMVDLDDWRANSRTIESASSYNVVAKSLYDFGEPERIQAVRSERNLLRMLGVGTAIGRTFRDDDPPNVAVISAALWQRHFGADPSCLGRKISLDRQPYTVIGVMPESFQFPYQVALIEAWIPWDTALTPGSRTDGVGRLRAGAGIGAARAELASMVRRVQERSPAAGIKGRGVLLTPLAEVVSGSMRTPLFTLLGAVGLVLLIACANVANLLLARSARRSHEIAVRAALGAGRRRLIQQLLTESVLLGVAGGAAGLGLAVLFLRAAVRLSAGQIPRAWEIGLDWRVFLFLLTASVLTGIAFGLLPAIAVSGVDPQAALHKASGGRAVGLARSGRWLRDGLVVAEIAMSFVLLVSAGLVLRAFLGLQNTPAGMVTKDVLTLRLAASTRDFPGRGDFGRYLQNIEDRVRQLPGIREAGFIQYLPLQNFGWYASFTIRGRPVDEAAPMQAELRYVTPGYFAAMRIPLLRGRNFTERDVLDGPFVIVVNEALGRTYFPGEDPVGRVTNRGTIVGVVGDVRASALDRPASPEIYYTALQNIAATADAGVTLVVKSQASPSVLLPAIRETVHQINRYQVIYEVKPMDRVIAASLADMNLYTWLIGIFAALAALLAVSGVYGVIAYAVAARTQEFGLRVALGAGRGEIFGLVLRHGVVMIAGGVAIGVAGTMASGRLIGSLVRGATTADWGMLMMVGVLLGIAGFAACAAPARQALRVDPNVALRYE